MRALTVMAMLSVLPAVSQAVIVDRVAVVVGNKVITQSEIEERIRLTAFQNGETPDLSPASRKQATQRLIDQRLIEREMDVGHFPGATPERGAELLADYEKSKYPSGHESLLEALAADGLAESDIEGDLMRQADLLTFLDLRFRPAVQVDDQEVQKYFDEKVPAGPLKKQEGLSGMRAQIEQLIANQRADKDLDNWLQDQRKRVPIEYVDKDLQ